MGEGTFYEGIQEKAVSEPGIFPKVNRQNHNELLARMNAGIESFVGFLPCM
ncbi:hypothetical protein [Butyrivibrio fibrisolvens]|uniref:hypothetical protein n=1 Tax=Butyrivibrio fibrisolvens TaxID=831 RepID=UPI0015A5D018|nr:hypothetical protein [Butyrivibrio fibrisolvens]